MRGESLGANVNLRCFAKSEVLDDSLHSISVLGKGYIEKERI